jgi:hypothetical protein
VDKVTWVVQANMLNKERQDNVAAMLASLCIPFIGVNVIPFQDELTYLFDEPTHKNVIPYGSTALCRRAAKLGWKGYFFNPETFLVERWVKERTDMLNQRAHIMTVSEAIDWCRSRESVRRMYHVRPNEDLKLFTGLVLDVDELEHWLDKTEVQADGQLQLDTQIVISPAVNIQAEWRWFVVGGRVIDGSMYRLRGSPRREHETDSATIAEAQAVADRWLPHPTCVMDIGLIENRPKVIEFNCLNGSGFYKHDVAKILQAVTNEVERS